RSDAQSLCTASAYPAGDDRKVRSGYFFAPHTASLSAKLLSEMTSCIGAAKSPTGAKTSITALAVLDSRLTEASILYSVAMTSKLSQDPASVTLPTPPSAALSSQWMNLNSPPAGTRSRKLPSASFCKIISFGTVTGGGSLAPQVAWLSRRLESLKVSMYGSISKPFSVRTSIVHLAVCSQMSA